MQKEQDSADSLVCPSFSTYSTNKLNDIAYQVTREHQNDNVLDANDNDFEFVAFQKAEDEVFVDGNQATTVFPIFNRDLMTATNGGGKRRSSDEAIQISLEKLMIEDEESRSDPSPSPSSSEAEDDLESIPPGTYCVWTPKSVQASPNRCKKSKSTGSSSSKRWKLLDLLRRSNSERKESSMVLLTPLSDSEKKKKKGAKGESSKEEGKVAGKKVLPAAKKLPMPVTVSAHEALYVKKRELRRVDNRRSYLPYRQDLVGFCVSLNAVRRGFPLHF